MDVDVLVVGAGPTGLSLAAQVHAHGASVRIIDRALDRAHESRALAVQARTLEVLAGVGVSDELVRRGNTATRFVMHAGRRAVELPLFDPGTRDTDYPFLLFVSQAVTEQVLAEHLAGRGVPVERGVELTQLAADGGAIVATVRRADGQDETVRARFVVGCDGVHSTVRREAGIAFRGGTYPQAFALADLDVDGLPGGRAHAYLGDRGIMFFFPLEDPVGWRMIVMRPPGGWPRPGGDTGDTTVADLQTLVDDATGGAVRLHEPVWLTDFKIHHRQVDTYRSGPVFVAGDAAHVHSPAGAQGMNTGIQDSWNLGWKLALVARGVADPALLDSYDAERAPVGRLVVRFTDRAFTIAASTNPVVGVLRRELVPRLAPLFGRLGPARARAFRTLAELDIAYRHSPAVQEGRPRPPGGPRAGDRLPTAPVVRDGATVSLQRELAEPGLHVLLCGRSPGWRTDRLDRLADLLRVHLLSRTAEPGALHDPGGAALRALGVPADASAHYLVRPDGYIGYRAAGTDLTGLIAYLDRWFPALGAARPSVGQL
ncbi:MAG TPA: FAD-dependent monooxygenase [Micromonosporaceae bacterium]|jgi:2-polyprenyl-6-methoxyphenol hydroxylase-like FAD-dependent oxidoreductase